MLRKEKIDDVDYYYWFIDNVAGDLFTNWKDIEYQKEKLVLENKKHEENRKKTLGKRVPSTRRMA